MDVVKNEVDESEIKEGNVESEIKTLETCGFAPSNSVHENSVNIEPVKSELRFSETPRSTPEATVSEGRAQANPAQIDTNKVRQPLPNRFPQFRANARGADEMTVRCVENRILMPVPSEDDMRLIPRPQLPESSNTAKTVPQYNKAFRYDYAAINNDTFPSMQYTVCELPPYKPGINSLERGLNVFLVGEDAQTVTTPGPYSSAKGDMCMRGGSWYFEIEVVNPAVRVGIGRREATCEGPVGFDAYSYGVQSNNGWKVHCARISKFTEPLAAGDTIGFHVHLPIDSRPQNVVRSRVPLKYQDQIWLESMNYKSTLDMEQFVLPKNYREPLSSEVIPGSFCKVWRNGALVGTLAEPLRDFRPPHSQFEFWLRLPSVDDGYLGYYPMISVYKGGAARLNCGPNFKNPIPVGAKPLCERYDEQIADDFVMDLVNEIVFEEIDEKLPSYLQNRQRLKTFKEKKLVVKKMF